MAQWLKTSAAKPDHLSLIIELTQWLEQLPKALRKLRQRIISLRPNWAAQKDAKKYS